MRSCIMAIVFIFSLFAVQISGVQADSGNLGDHSGTSSSSNNDISSNPAGVNTKHHPRQPGGETHNPSNPGPLLPNSTGNQTDSHTSRVPPKGIPSDTDRTMHSDTGL